MKKLISELKSARVITGVNEIQKFFERARSGELENGRDLKNAIGADDNGRLNIVKDFLGLSDLTGTEYALPPATDLQTMAGKIHLNWEAGYEKRVVPFYGSDERVDRHGDIVDQTWDFKNYEKNPLLLYNHNWDMPPIGNCLSWETVDRNEGGYEGKALRLLALFAPASVSSFADSIMRLCQANFLRTVSVGFFPGEVIDIQDEAERAEMGLGRWGYIFCNNELIELSPTSVPANAGAYSILNNAKKGGLLKAQDLNAIRELRRLELIKSGEGSKSWHNADSQMIYTFKNLFPEMQLPAHRNIDHSLLLEEIEIAGQRKNTNNPTPATVTDDSIDEDPFVHVLSHLQDMRAIQEQHTAILGSVNDKMDKLMATAGTKESDQSQKGGESDPRVSALANLLK